ncbi:hypothetical protein [Thermoplasma sp.]|uniref:hypothetical protein n=1 Tax=Thermoplasma sp. TaxID=1973142 RepID=UPI00128563A6|nr:hypothetical protein [Thermoplasma sp.]KAA8923484.1 MAG: hypothetical protein F6Q11_00585 [Thermoplasma sp.]
MALILLIPFLASGGNNISNVLSRIDEIAISISAVLISLLWIPIAFEFFSTDENKRMIARTRLKNAAIGTFIYVLAVSGLLYAIFNYIITGS